MKQTAATLLFVPTLLLTMLLPVSGAGKPRARDLGVPFDGTPGPLNAITDVAGVEVGHATLIEGSGALKVGAGPVRSGVTAVLPRGKASGTPAFAGWYALNGNGEMTGTTWVEESGVLEGPVMITNTHSVGVVRDAVIAWQVSRGGTAQPWSLPVVAETYDGFLNDINGFHVKPTHAQQAIESAAGGRVTEGNAGGGTGMICYGFKGGIGTASRALDRGAGFYTVGVLVQANFGGRGQLRIAGVPVGTELAKEKMPVARMRPAASPEEYGSIIVVVATDAPLMPHQLKRLARRVPMGIARTGAVASNGSGDIFIAFSTANADAVAAEAESPAGAGGAPRPATSPVTVLHNARMSALFEATVQATEEAIVNALVAAEDMTGVDNHKVFALPHDRLKDVLKKYARLRQ